MLRDQVKMDKSEHRIQNNIPSEGNIVRSRIISTSKEHEPYVSDENNLMNKIKVMNEEKWCKPKKCMPINHFYKTHEMK